MLHKHTKKKKTRNFENNCIQNPEAINLMKRHTEIKYERNENAFCHPPNAFIIRHYRILILMISYIACLQNHTSYIYCI